MKLVDDVGVGDLRYFLPGLPHSIQGLVPDGCEFLPVRLILRRAMSKNGCGGNDGEDAFGAGLEPEGAP